MRSTVTSVELLAGLRDPGNQGVWAEYVQRYRPVLVEFARRLGLAPDDAEDAAQQTLLAFVEAFRAGRYDPDKGRLRHWLFGIAANSVRDARRRAGRAGKAWITETGFFDQLPDDEALAGVFDQEWRTSLLGHCLSIARTEVSPQTYEAFERFACCEEPAVKVAKTLQMTENAVYGAKRRVLERVRTLFRQLSDTW